MTGGQRMVKLRRACRAAQSAERNLTMENSALKVKVENLEAEIYSLSRIPERR